MSTAQQARLVLELALVVAQRPEHVADSQVRQHHEHEQRSARTPAAAAAAVDAAAHHHATKLRVERCEQRGQVFDSIERVRLVPCARAHIAALGAERIPQPPGARHLLDVDHVVTTRHQSREHKRRLFALLCWLAFQLAERV